VRLKFSLLLHSVFVENGVDKKYYLLKQITEKANGKNLNFQVNEMHIMHVCDNES
jgi:hypothetical protein